MIKEVATYQFKENNVRVFQDTQGEPLFVARDILDVLGVVNVTNALQKLRKLDFHSMKVCDAKGQVSRMYVVNESGLYQLLLRSDKPQAKEFQHWVTATVLPSIRKTGSYSMPQVEPITNVLSELQVLKSAISILEQHETRLNAIEAKMAQPVQTPKLLPQTTLSKRAQFNMTTRDMAKVLNLPHQECYGEVYKRYYYTNHINLKERAKHAHIRPIDVAEQIGCFDDLINICNEMRAK